MIKKSTWITTLGSVALLTLTLGFAPTGPVEVRITSFAELKKLMVDPPADYRSAPLWDWNDKITEEGIDFHLKKFKEGGLGGVFIHPRPGLITEYLSDDWYHLFDYTVRKAKTLGMKVWIYDEDSYPSGFAGGHVPAQMPESYKYGTGLKYERQENLKPDTLKYEVILKEENKRFTDITGEWKNHLGKPGTYYLFYKTYGPKSYWYGNFPYVDLLQKGVTEKFLELTMKGYEKYDRDEFGKTLMGSFTDEPNLEAAMAPKTALRWTSDLYAEFEKRWGYDLKTNLPSLVEEVGNWKKVRHDYFEIILELFVDRWAKPYGQYCADHGLKLTGHYWEHGWPIPTDGSDESAFYRFHQQPAIDMLGNQYVPEGQGGQFGNTRAVRELGTSSNQTGHIRTLSETYGGAGWEITFANQKKLVDWEVVMGVNFVNQHLSYYTIKGVRKFDYPPSFGYHEPWWDNYKLMGDYIGRISMAMSSGEQVNQTLVLQPNTTAWMYFSRVTKNSTPDSIRKDFKYFVYQLERNHIEYDLGSENVLKALGKVKGGNLIVGNRSYNRIVIPKWMENIDKSTFALLKEYLQQGGKVVAFTSDIPYIDGAESSAMKDLRLQFTKQWTIAKDIHETGIKELLLRPEFSVEEKAPVSGELYFQRRMMEDGQLLFLVNTDPKNGASAQITLPGNFLTKVDLLNGQTKSIPAKVVNGKATFQVDLEPIGSALYFAGLKGQPEPAPVVLPKGGTEVAADGELKVKPEAENILVLDYLDLKTSKLNLKETYFMKAMRQLYDSYGFPMGNPWQHKIQFKQDYLALDTFKVNSAFEVNYRFSVSDTYDKEAMAKLMAVVERPEVWDVYVNNQPILPNKEWWIDRDFHKFPIGKEVQNGVNTLTLKAKKMSVHAELMPVYIVGSFVLNPLSRGFEIAPGEMTGLGSWRMKGYPFYSGKVDYTSTFTVPEGGKNYKLKLNSWDGMVAEVWVNQQKVGLIAFAPYELDLGKVLQKGKNEITVKVNGSLKNTFGYFYKANDRWIIGPGDWDTAPVKTAGFGDYILMDYGLKEPFSLIVAN